MSALRVPDGASNAPLPTHFEFAALPPFRLDLTVWALRRRPGNSVDRWDGRTYARSLPVAGAIAELAVTQVRSGDSPRLEVSVTADRPVARDRMHVEVGEFLRHALGLQVDLGDFYRHAARDASLRGLVERFRGLKPPRFPSLFECLANAIACQQLTLTVGIELLNRLAATYGRPAPGAIPTSNAFPQPHDLLGLEPGALRALGFSRQKSRALLELASRVEHGALPRGAHRRTPRRCRHRCPARPSRRGSLVGGVCVAPGARTAQRLPRRRCRSAQQPTAMARLHGALGL